ncbi:MAG: hypothetical protein AAFY41_16665, partial [Bacteroidota bacterium]
GLKDEAGTITIPPVYEELGWSDGNYKVVNNTIGFRQGNLWGLITVRNKALTGQKYYSLTPIHSGYFKASLKEGFSNRLSYGVLDTKGRIRVNFNYFSIESFGTNWLVSNFDGTRQLFGIVSFDNKVAIPLHYISISKNRTLVIAKRINRKLDLFKENGHSIHSGIDSLRYNKGWIIYQNGYAGFLSFEGDLVHPLKYKSILIEEEKILPEAFPEWTIYKNDTFLMKWSCDSLKLSENEMLIAYLNGSQHFIIDDTTLLNHHELMLHEVSNGHMIVSNSKTDLWSVLNRDGTELISGYDSLVINDNHYLAFKEDCWRIIDKKGKVKNRVCYEKLLIGMEQQIVAKQGGHWGIILSNSEQRTRCKYDSIIVGSNAYIVSYLNLWG